MNYKRKLFKGFLLTLLFSGAGVDAQADKEKKDNTGTNPINFTNDLRLYFNFSELNTAGDGDSQTLTLEYRSPILDGKAQWRIRMRNVNNEIDTNNDGVNELDESGFGAMDIRFLTVPYLNMEKKFAFAVGLELLLDTANDPELRSGSTSLGPQAFAVFFKPPGGGALVAPAYQHVFNISGKVVNRTQLDVFYLWTFKKPFINWLMANPQGVIDYQNDDTDSWNIDFEAGKMVTKNQSFYLRPGIGIGDGRFFDWDMEVGLKCVW